MPVPPSSAASAAASVTVCDPAGASGCGAASAAASAPGGAAANPAGASGGPASAAAGAPGGTTSAAAGASDAAASAAAAASSVACGAAASACASAAGEPDSGGLGAAPFPFITGLAPGACSGRGGRSRGEQGGTAQAGKRAHNSAAAPRLRGRRSAAAQGAGKALLRRDRLRTAAGWAAACSCSLVQSAVAGPLASIAGPGDPASAVPSSVRCPINVSDKSLESNAAGAARIRRFSSAGRRRLARCGGQWRSDAYACPLGATAGGYSVHKQDEGVALFCRRLRARARSLIFALSTRRNKWLQLRAAAGGVFGLWA